MKLGFIFLLILLISSLFIIAKPVKADNPYFFEYALSSNYAGNVTASKGSLSTTTSFRINSTATMYVTLVEKNSTCNFVTLNLTGVSSITYQLFFSNKMNIPLKFSNSTIICSIKDLWIKLFMGNFTTSTEGLNVTPQIQYNSTTKFIGIEKVDNINSLHLRSLFNSSGIIYYNETLYNYNLNSTVDFFLSITDNILIKTNSITNLNLNSMNKSSNLKIRVSGNLGISLLNTNYPYLSYEGPLNISDFKTNLGVEFTIITNTTLKSINVNGGQMTLYTIGNGTGFLIVVYGKPKLGISIENINLKIDGQNSKFFIIYMVDSAILSTKYLQSERRIDIDLGANVGVYNYTQTTATSSISNTSWLNILYPVIIALVFALIIIILFWRRSTFKSF